MPRAVANKLYRTFVKGLITEAGPLTYPENASIDEDNCVISRRGNRYRRLGFDLEDGFNTSIYYLTDNATDPSPHAQYTDVAVKTFKWEAVAKTNLNFLVYQQGRYVQFFDMAVTPLSSSLKPYFIDLETFLAPGQSDAAHDEVSFTAGKGILFVCHPKLDPFYVTYDPVLDTIVTTRITVQVRDQIGLYDGLANDEEPTSLSNPHYYNLLNQGWISTGADVPQVYFDDYGNSSTYTPSTSLDPINSYHTTTGRYPGNNKQWWTGKSVNTGDFDVNLLNAFYAGNNRAPRGHFIVNAFQTDRSAVSGVPSLDVVSTTERPVSITFFSGRVWYGTHSAVYFSQVLDDVRKSGFCYQDADPTSEVISDLIATDGGVIPIPEMGRCVRILASGAGVLVFATNGIWFISGNTQGFSATDISVVKVSPIGTDSPNSIVEAELNIYWWSAVGIMAMKQQMGAFGPIDGKFDKQNISETTIQGFYNDEISEEARPYVTGIYDPAANVIQWLFKDFEDPYHRYRYNRILNLDLTLGAFYPWSVSIVSNSYIVGVFQTPKVSQLRFADDVTVGGETIISSGETIISRDFTIQLQNSQIKYLCVIPQSNNWYFTFGHFKNTSFADWQKVDNIGVTYDSYVLTGYELLDDAMRKKQTPYVFCYFRRTETAFISGGADYIFDRPSSCLFQTRWDWSSSAVSNKWSREVQAYRFNRLPGFSGGLDFDTGFPIVVTKNKVRGSGKSIQFKFSCNEIGKDFDLLGWAVEYVGNTQP